MPAISPHDDSAHALSADESDAALSGSIARRKIRAVTFLMTDVEGSTPLWERFPDEMSAAMIRHHQIVREAIGSMGGDLPSEQGEGDSIVGAFGDARIALDCAVRVQQELAAEPWPPPIQIRVRMALHTEDAWKRDDDNYVGTGIIRCARIRSHARGQQILVSGATLRELGTETRPGVYFVDQGVHRLKHLSRPEHLTEVRYPGLNQNFPVLSSTWEIPNNLDEDLTSFVGRRRDKDRVVEELERARLVTLTGPGGVGKTRLATHVAKQLLDSYPDGVWFLDLASRTSAETLPRIMADTLGLQGGEEVEDILAWLSRSLRAKSVLLIFDNCEHVLEETAEVADRVLRETSAPHIIATSREPLRISGEYVHVLPPLEFPDRGTNSNAIRQTESVRLLIERAERHCRDLSISSDDDWAALAAICQRLEGLPLAIELVAPRLRHMTLPEILAAMDDRFTLLSHGSRSAPPRQQTLRDLLDWSYQLLDDEERSAFRRLAVFAGEFSLAAVAAVQDEPPNQTLSLMMSRLVDKSLVVRVADPVESRFSLLETTAEYAAEHLASAGEESDARDRHLKYFLRVAQEMGEQLRTSENPDWKDVLQREEPNLVAALAWAQRASRARELAELVSALWFFWDIRSHWEAGGQWLRAALQAPLDPELELRVQAGASFMSDNLGDVHGVRWHAPRTVALWEQLGNPEARAWFAAWSLCDLAFAALLEDDVDSSVEWARSALEVAGKSDEPSARARSLFTLAYALQSRDLLGAEKWLLEALSLARHHGMQVGLPRILGKLAEIALARKDMSAARGYLEEVLDVARSMDDKVIMGSAMLELATVEAKQGDRAAASELRRRGHQILKEIGLDQGHPAFGRLHLED